MLKRYAVIAMLSVLSLGMMLLMDFITGQQWQNTLYNIRYQLLAGSEQLMIAALFAGWLVPDLIKVIAKRRKKRGSV
ncbi:hypothetical protein [Paenibacillus sp. YPG26]|uniref:hypothetical protein n=1 Tax=Paenibacillus sp. YPG26 TaxID=2878915 RepID=UPI00203D5669|nr:hypothetical protein [Paenibacillus sp. YPG26]USB32942.1 hypothetical protein LDO05_17100 [Paenibacillus sp. YPG26]